MPENSGNTSVEISACSVQAGVHNGVATERRQVNEIGNAVPDKRDQAPYSCAAVEQTAAPQRGVGQPSRPSLVYESALSNSGRTAHCALWLLHLQAPMRYTGRHDSCGAGCPASILLLPLLSCVSLLSAARGG